MINFSTEEKIRKRIINGTSDQTTASMSNVSCATVRKIRRMMTLVGYIEDPLKEQVIAKLCGGYTHKEIADTMKIDKEIVSAISRFCYLRSKKKMAKVPATLCLACKVDIDAINDEPCFKTDAATNGNIEHEARSMFKVICDIVGLDSLCIVASPVFGAIAKEAGQIKKRILGGENEKEENETLRSS